MVEQPPTVMVIDDDPGVRDSLGKLLQSAGFRVSLLGSVSEFLAADRPEGPACLVLDVRLPGQSGLELQRELAGAKRQLPIIFITGHGDVPIAVRAMKGGAVEFLQKPFNDQLLLDTVQSALSKFGALWEQEARRQECNKNFASLTRRETEVLNLLRTGKPNKVIAALLDISVRTVEGHRASIMTKTGTRSLGELIEMLHAHD